MQGCKCHPAECIETARKGDAFACPDGMKGKVGPFIRVRLEEARERWRLNQANCRLSDEIDPDGSISAALYNGYNHLIALSVKKMVLRRNPAMADLGRQRSSRSNSFD